MSGRGQDLTELLEALEAVLQGPTRSRIVEGIAARGELKDWLRRLRTAMSEHRLGSGADRFDVAGVVRRLDVRTRKDGFHVLHAWSHRAHDFTDDIVPVLMIDFFEAAAPETADGRFTVALVLDYYLLHLLALCAMRAWDVDDPNGVLDRVTRLVGVLQEGDGSGHRFVDDAETLIIYALSQFHPEEQAYDRVIERIDGLNALHRLGFARVSAAVLGAHLRWGFWLMYGRDVVRMRDDNVGDYPWLLWCVDTLTRAWSDPAAPGAPSGASWSAGDDLAGALVLALAADPWAFTGAAPAALRNQSEAHGRVRALLAARANELLADLERHRPTKESYAPLALHFNFPHNALVAIVTLALLEGRPQSLSLNALFRRGDDATDADRERLARALMAFSSARPDRLGHRGAMLVAYDPLSAMRSFSMTTKALKELAERSG